MEKKSEILTAVVFPDSIFPLLHISLDNFNDYLEPLYKFSNFADNLWPLLIAHFLPFTNGYKYIDTNGYKECVPLLSAFKRYK